jgi:hypothetical protein
MDRSVSGLPFATPKATGSRLPESKAATVAKSGVCCRLLAVANHQGRGLGQGVQAADCMEAAFRAAVLGEALGAVLLDDKIMPRTASSERTCVRCRPVSMSSNCRWPYNIERPPELFMALTR